MNLRDLQYIVAVAEHRNFNRAAEACHVSQPSLSKQIQKLEEYLGIVLFERSNRKVSITPVGERVIAHARLALQQADAMRQIARASGDPLSGEVKLGIIPTIAPYLLPRILPQIGRRFPNVNLALHEETTGQLTFDLKRGKLDAALLALPLGDDELEEWPLYEEAFLLAVPLHHRLAKKRRVRLDELSSERLLLLADGHCLRTQALQVCQLSGATRDEDFSATSLETLRQMVAAGYGITLMPSLAAEIPMQGICYVAFENPTPSRSVGLMIRKTTPRRALLKMMAEAIGETMGGLPGGETRVLGIKSVV